MIMTMIHSCSYPVHCSTIQAAQETMPSQVMAHPTTLPLAPPSLAAHTMLPAVGTLLEPSSTYTGHRGSGSFAAPPAPPPAPYGYAIACLKHTTSFSAFVFAGFCCLTTTVVKFTPSVVHVGHVETCSRFSNTTTHHHGGHTFCWTSRCA